MVGEVRRTIEVLQVYILNLLFIYLFIIIIIIIISYWHQFSVCTWIPTYCNSTDLNSRVPILSV
jgi:hypothetical protein